ncbi:hypothetical protein L1987_13843 [Smallanthus sonchifolius]|uniref:Uncharacterized protein n=1 Tax=Smallanthus sonchifolius TaxID=185202 RepID=A0ACB9JJ74_9ASTR|nr:hypothetical protein L1987_13843 [Smallanthus sonchifolius]
MKVVSTAKSVKEKKGFQLLIGFAFFTVVSKRVNDTKKEVYTDDDFQTPPAKRKQLKADTGNPHPKKPKPNKQSYYPPTDTRIRMRSCPTNLSGVDFKSFKWCSYIITCLQRTKKKFNGIQHYNGPLPFLCLLYAHESYVKNNPGAKQFPAIKYYKTSTLYSLEDELICNDTVLVKKILENSPTEDRTRVIKNSTTKGGLVKTNGNNSIAKKPSKAVLNNMVEGGGKEDENEEGDDASTVVPNKVNEVVLESNKADEEIGSTTRGGLDKTNSNNGIAKRPSKTVPKEVVEGEGKEDEHNIEDDASTVVPNKVDDMVLESSKDDEEIMNLGDENNNGSLIIGTLAEKIEPISMVKTNETISPFPTLDPNFTLPEDDIERQSYFKETIGSLEEWACLFQRKTNELNKMVDEVDK